ncbi:ATP-binding protein [Burkholderia lata]|uniref:ATP-binding protein n=1 Tax=Burkholderia lata (strain ATCC 17760 / DSM 23089 / LMG 22485 / NCIMB 9086 / R18194 / 383) TaxID=482957 RepID=UPI001454AB2A|nr:ATP-binding protein [Burkholderia lata]VWM12269.1 hypothetical protein BLA6992_04573 [Burkholderia lata]
MSASAEKQNINAHPTKTFFVDMLTRDIALEQAVLDLVDNSVDGAKSMKDDGEHPFEGRQVEINFDRDNFRIWDNCGGFDSDTARDYAFRFGRPAAAKATPHSIGQFGVGMKRALFKFGNRFIVRSATAEDSWSVDVDVPTWENDEPNWEFPWAKFDADDKLSQHNPGTEIVVTNLRQEVSWKFSLKNFENNIISLIKSKHRQFIAGGLQITVNGTAIDATSLQLLIRDDGTFAPGTDQLVFGDDENTQVKVRIIVGVGPSVPREAGWYVVCNGRVILEADRRSITGWGLIEESSNSIAIPTFHNQFARFRGIVHFDSQDSSRVPWNTTKTDVDQDNSVWQATFERMMEMMRPVISFLNDLDKDIDEHTREQSPLYEHISSAKAIRPEELTLTKAEFSAPARGTLAKRIKTVKIQYSRPVSQVEHLMKELSLGSAKAVGERTFDLIYDDTGAE